jgi:Haemolysin secretion/activation protein ShlB/FhaC/HecB
MQSLATACCAGLCLLATCAYAYAQPVPSRGQYRVSFKIVGGKLAVDRDAFLVAPSFVKFEPAIRRSVGQAIAGITGPLAPSLLGDSAWADYIIAYQAWSAADPDRLDLGTLFSSDFLFANLLQQTPDSGVVLNEDEIDPLSGSISFSILPLFDSNVVSVQLPAMLESRRRTRVPQLRKRLARLNGSLWSSTNIRKAVAPLYTNLGLTPQVILLPRNQSIQIVEGPRIASILLPADQVPQRDVNRLLWDLLDTGHFRRAPGKRIVDFHRDLGYAEGDQPYAIPYQIQALQLLISQLGYTLTTDASTRTGASQYVDLRVQKAPKKHTRSLAGGFAYKPGQGFSALGNAQLSALNLSGGGPSGTLGSGSYSASYLGASASANAGVSLERNRVLDGVKVDEQTTAEFATLDWEPWRSLDGNTVTLQLVPSHALILNETLNTIRPGLQFVHNNFTAQYPSRTLIEPRVLIGLRFADCILTANTHRSFDNWEYDLSGRFENAIGDPPIFELPSLGGADTVRGFRADDAIGRRLWSSQNELWWHFIPRLPPLKIATFFDLGGAYQTTGSYAGLRAGPGTGLRIDLRVAVLKFDWAYGFGEAATGGSRGKFYFNVVLPTH